MRFCNLLKKYFANFQKFSGVRRLPLRNPYDTGPGKKVPQNFNSQIFSSRKNSIDWLNVPVLRSANKGDRKGRPGQRIENLSEISRFSFEKGWNYCEIFSNFSIVPLNSFNEILGTVWMIKGGKGIPWRSREINRSFEILNFYNNTY